MKNSENPPEERSFAPSAEQEYPAGPIPRRLHSFETGQAFARCLVCERNLLEPLQDYTIHKTFQAEEVILEYAMCRECSEEMNREFSEESRQTLVRLMTDLVEIDDRLEQFTRGQDGQIAPFEEWIATCALTGKELRDCRQYSLMAVCMGDRLVYAGYPLMISDDGEQLMAEVMSAETRRRLDEFVGHHFTPPEAALDPTLTPQPTPVAG